jgi:hypothetical protein
LACHPEPLGSQTQANIITNTIVEKISTGDIQTLKRQVKRTDHTDRVTEDNNLIAILGSLSEGAVF